MIKKQIIFNLFFDHVKLAQIGEVGTPLKLVKEEHLGEIAKGVNIGDLDLPRFNPSLVKDSFRHFYRLNWGQDGSAPLGREVFHNRDNLLPRGDYREYTVLPLSKNGSFQYLPEGRRGRLRFVRNTGNGRVYFTFAHYECFVLVSEDSEKYLGKSVK